MEIKYKKTTVIVTLIESNKIRKAIKIQTEENMTEEVVLEDKLKVVVIEKEVVLEKVIWLKMMKMKKK